MTSRPRHPKVLRLGSQDSLVGSAVQDLQAELRRLQVLQPGEDAACGLFDAATERALRRFQWFAGHVPAALGPDGACVARAPQRLRVDGVCGAATRRLLDEFARRGWAATGLLVRVRFERLPHTRANAGFRALLDGTPGVGLCERGFAPVLAGLDAAARELGLYVFVNELFRIDGADAGAIGPPPSFSSHRIGRAVDLQLGTEPGIVSGRNPEDAARMRSAAPGSSFARFRRHAQTALRCRWGGDFDPVDLPHFDHQLLPSGGPTWLMHHYFDQLQVRQALINPAAIPDDEAG